ncbi:unnamed protein product, partial [Discosporangium mesarthrocarpum]
VAKDQENVTIELEAPPTCRLIGNVFGLPRRMRVLGALLRLSSLAEDGGETRTRWVEMQDGELDFALCPSGDVRIEISADGYAPFTITRMLEANETHNLGEVLLEPGARLRGVVRDADGKNVADAAVVLGEESDLDLYEPAVRSAVDGSFTLQGVTSRSNQLVVRAPGFAASTVEIQLPRDVLSADPLEVVLERGATIEVVATNAPRSGGLVQLRRNGHLLANEELDDDGKAWFANRSAGSYTVELFGGQVEPLKV